MKKLLLLIPASLLMLSACGTKSYTYETIVEVEGTGSAVLTLKAPKFPDGDTETVTLPARRAYVIEGLGPVSAEVRSETGEVTCKLTVEKEAQIKQTGKIATCKTEITEDTEN